MCRDSAGDESRASRDGDPHCRQEDVLPRRDRRACLTCERQRFYCVPTHPSPAPLVGQTALSRDNGMRMNNISYFSTCTISRKPELLRVSEERKLTSSDTDDAKHSMIHCIYGLCR
ncbi:unnamed protein product [Boreogadus saida]